MKPTLESIRAAADKYPPIEGGGKKYICIGYGDENTSLLSVFPDYLPIYCNDLGVMVDGNTGRFDDWLYYIRESDWNSIFNKPMTLDEQYAAAKALLGKTVSYEDYDKFTVKTIEVYDGGRSSYANENYYKKNSYKPFFTVNNENHSIPAALARVHWSISVPLTVGTAVIKGDVAELPTMNLTKEDLKTLLAAMD